MRLADFIRENKAPIIAQWESFARSLSPADNMTVAQLRDHIEQILLFIIADLESPQTDYQQMIKSQGKSVDLRDGESAAETHGDMRHEVGFDIVQMVSEYRALRTSVIKLWTHSEMTLTDTDVVDLVRFNEAIDQALAESVVTFTQKVDYTKDLLLGVLGHDIRNPLSAMTISAQLIPRLGTLNEKQSQLASQILSSGERIANIVTTLLDLTRSRVGTGLPIFKAPVDIGVIARNVVDELQVQHPDRTILLTITGDLKGGWDATRIGQIFSNLVGNAVQYGVQSSPISILTKGDDLGVTISVHNLGTPIPPKQLNKLFHSFTRGEGHDSPTGNVTTNLGLGLFITKEIVLAHEGTIKVVSNEKDGTTFTVRLPRTSQ